MRNHESDSVCARRLKMLAGSTRLTVLQLLLDGPKHVGELNLSLKLNQSLLSHHLQALRKEGLVASERDGKSIRYRLTPATRHHSGHAIDLGCCVLSFTDRK